MIAYLRCGELVSAAQTCETLASANSAEAEHWLQEAIKHYRKAKQPVESFDLLLRHPQLQATLSGRALPHIRLAICCCHRPQQAYSIWRCSYSWSAENVPDCDLLLHSQNGIVV